MALSSIIFADVPLRNYSPTHSLFYTFNKHVYSHKAAQKKVKKNSTKSSNIQPSLHIQDLQDRRLGLPVSDWPGTGVSGRRLSPYFRRQHVPTPIDGHSDVRRLTFK